MDSKAAVARYDEHTCLDYIQDSIRRRRRRSHRCSREEREGEEDVQSEHEDQWSRRQEKGLRSEQHPCYHGDCHERQRTERKEFSYRQSSASSSVGLTST